MDFILGALFVLLLFLAGVGGAYLGMQMAVDHTKRDGHFKAYDKKWRAVEVTD
jgi:hypothetical protein